ncbi:MAG: lysophospholipid acyltransferase family protein [Bacilli bacterium]
MYNIGLKSLETKTVDNFATIRGLKFRKAINKPLRFVLEKATKGKITVESYPSLEKGKPYIFASSHYHPEDIIANLATLDRSAYALFGTTDQLEHNPQMYAAWLNGIIYVDRLNKDSRAEALKKMLWILEHGTSVILYPEGGWNNTENLPLQDIFPGAYKLSKATGIEVVPVSNFLEPTSNNIYINYGKPMDLSKYDSETGRKLLRDTMRAMMFEQIAMHSIPIKRSELIGDVHLQFMEERRKMYLQNKWTRDVWDEELTVYIDKNITTPEQVREELDKVIITHENAHIMAPILVRRREDERYNFKKYMKENWNK